MTSYQDTRTRRGPDSLAFIREGMRSPGAGWINYQYASYGSTHRSSGQTITSVRTTSKAMPEFETPLAASPLLYMDQVHGVVKELDRTVRPKSRLQRKVWQICNPHPVDMKKFESTVGKEQTTLFFLKCLQKGWPAWTAYDFHYTGNIMDHALGFVIPISEYSALPTAITRFQHLALTKAYAKSKASVYQVMVYLGELKETVEMLLNPLSALKNFLKQPDGKRILSGEKLIGDLWLQYRYGLLPLMLTVQDVIEQLIVKLHKGFRVKQHRAGSHLSNVRTSGTLDQNLCANLLLRSQRSIETGIQGFATLATKHNTWSQERILGTRWQDLPATLYELTPLSFVWDWIWNIGSWIQSIVPDPSVTYLANTVSIKRTYEVKLQPIAIGLGPLWTNKGLLNAGSVGLKEASYREDTLVRTVNLQIPSLPIYQAKLLSLSRSADAISLIVTRILSQK